jgi:DNA-binding GntR family transcriptional regulator
VHRVSLREQLRHRLLADVIAGRLQPGERLGVAALAARHEVSPTPVREALTELARDGVVIAHANRGFFVPDLSLEEAGHAYPLLGVLEGLALESQRMLSVEQLAALRAHNEALRTATTPQERVDADARWHRAFTAGCPNPLLNQMIETLRAKVERYERAFMQATGEIGISYAEHETLVRVASDGSVRDAARRLAKHWKRSLMFIEARITDRAEP